MILPFSDNWIWCLRFTVTVRDDKSRHDYVSEFKNATRVGLVNTRYLILLSSYHMTNRTVETTQYTNTTSGTLYACFC